MYLTTFNNEVYTFLMTEIDTYLAQHATVTQRRELARLYSIVKRLAPTVDESISYGVPTFKLRGKPLIYFAAFPNHMSVYPASDDMVQALGEKIARHRTGRGTLQFTEDDTFTDQQFEDIVQFRITQLS